LLDKRFNKFWESKIERS